MNKFCKKIELYDGAIILGRHDGSSTILPDAIVIVTKTQVHHIPMKDIKRFTTTNVPFITELTIKEKELRDSYKVGGDY